MNSLEFKSFIPIYPEKVRAIIYDGTERCRKLIARKSKGICYAHNDGRLMAMVSVNHTEIKEGQVVSIDPDYRIRIFRHVGDFLNHYKEGGL